MPDKINICWASLWWDEEDGWRTLQKLLFCVCVCFILQVFNLKLSFHNPCTNSFVKHHEMYGIRVYCSRGDINSFRLSVKFCAKKWSVFVSLELFYKSCFNVFLRARKNVVIVEWTIFREPFLQNQVAENKCFWLCASDTRKEHKCEAGKRRTALSTRSNLNLCRLPSSETEDVPLLPASPLFNLSVSRWSSWWVLKHQICTWALGFLCQ